MARSDLLTTVCGKYALHEQKVDKRNRAIGVFATGHSPKSKTVERPGVARKYGELAQKGDAVAMFLLGALYRRRRLGLPRDDAQAVNWYRKAATAP